jgi:hypothetical protein
MHTLGIPFGQNEVYCTIKLSRLIFKDYDQFRLSYLAEKLNIELKHAHRAEDDASVCLEIFRQCLSKASFKEVSESRIFNLDDFKKIESLKLKDHLKPIQEKIDSQEIMRIRYLGGSRKNEFRPIRPLSLLPLPQGNVLYAHCLDSNLYKIYNLNKIAECAPASEEDIKKYKKVESL